MFLLLAATPPGLVVGALFGANGKAATERATTENDGWTTYYDASGAITRRKVTSERHDLKCTFGCRRNNGNARWRTSSTAVARSRIKFTQYARYWPNIGRGL